MDFGIKPLEKNEQALLLLPNKIKVPSRNVVPDF